MSRPKIVLDTVVIFKALVLKDSAAKYVLGLYNEHLAGDIQLVIPKCVQAEFYGMLRSGRSEVKVNDEYVPRLLTHDEIVQYLSLFEGLFDFDFINQLRDLDWRQGKDENGNLYYKQTYNQVVQQEYGWSDLGQSYIERVMLHPPAALGAKDRWDYPVIACVIMEDAHLVITENPRDFPAPLIGIVRTIRVLGVKDAEKFDHYQMEYLPPLVWSISNTRRRRK